MISVPFNSPFHLVHFLWPYRHSRSGSSGPSINPAMPLSQSASTCFWGFLGFPVFAGGAGGASAFPWPHRWFPPSSSHSEHGSHLYWPMLNPAFSPSFANLLSSVLLFVSGAIGFMLVTHTDLQKHLLWSSPLYPCWPHQTSHHTITSKAIFASLKHHWYFK